MLNTLYAQALAARQIGSAEQPVVEDAHQDHHSKKAAHQLENGKERSWEELPRLAWVVSQSPEKLSNWSVALSALNCYCALHGIPLYYETETVLKDDRSWFYRRLSNVQKYLPHFQWVLHTDLDVLVANYSVGVTNFLDDRFDVILNDRVAPNLPPMYLHGTPELHSSAFFVKNSENGLKFMQHWLESSDNGRSVFSNTDNGQLHESILHLMSLESCLGSNVTNDAGVVTPRKYRFYLYCFRNKLRGVKSEVSAESPWYKLESPASGLAIKVYRLLAGFHRDIQGDPCTDISVACRFLPGDFLLHGKTVQKYVSPDLVDCSAGDGSSADVGNLVGGIERTAGEYLLHGREQGSWLSLKAARVAAAAAKLVTYSGCWEEGQNVCQGSSMRHLAVRYPFHDRNTPTQ